MIYQQLTEACERVRDTMQPDDAEKWRAYEALDSQSQLTWRRIHGHAEFCRLQRLSFHKHI